LKILKKFERALRRSEKILQEEKDEAICDSVINSEICFDLAWKTSKAYLYEYQKK